MDDTIQPAGPAKGLVDRAKAMIMTPKTEWPAVSAEPDSVSTVFLRYAVPLAAIGPVASLIGSQVFGYGAFGFTYRPPLGAALTSAVTSYILSLAGLFAIAIIANLLAPKFGGKDNFARAFKWCVYAFTAGWVAQIFGLIPMLSILSLLGLYSLYVLYLGAGPMMGVPQDKAAGYTAVTVIATIVMYLVVGALAAALTPAFVPAAGVAAADDVERVEVNLPGYGQIEVSDEGDRQTVEVPGVGRMEITRDGDTVTIDGENFNAEVRDTRGDTAGE